MTSRASGPLCPLCGGRSRPRYAGTIEPRAYFAENAYQIAHSDKATLDIFVCEDCGLGFSDHGLSEAELTSYYARQPEDRTYLDEEQGRRKTFKQALMRLEKLVGKRGCVFDIGSGPGVFLSEAKGRGWEVGGVEAAAWARRHAQEAFGISLFSPDEFHSMCSTGKLRGAYDAVTLFDVIEHVHDPAALLRDAASLLAPGGILFLTTPRFESFTRLILGRRWYFLFPAHIWYFTRASLGRALQKSGFMPLMWRWHVFHFSLGYLLSRLGLAALARPIARLEVPFCLGEEWEVYARLTPGARSHTL